jgi:sulfonate transport system substrate-binding protein
VRMNLRERLKDEIETANPVLASRLSRRGLRTRPAVSTLGNRLKNAPPPRLKPLAVLLALTGLLFSCLTPLLTLAACAVDQKVSSVRIGYQKYGSLTVAKVEGSLEKALTAQGIQVSWILFPAGPQLLEALNTGSIDLGSTGEAPPVFAQAASTNLVYFGNAPAFPKGEALIVREDSPIRSVSDLRGKRIALNKGSNVHFFLVKLLEKNGLKIDQITPEYLPPADAWAALEGGSVDAWAIWDPFMTAALERSGARIIQDAEGVAANREFFLTDRNFAQAHANVLLAVRDAVNRCGAWAQTKPQEVVRYLAPQIGMSESIVANVLQRQPWGFQPIDDQVISDQQAIADTFFALKLIPRPIRVADAVFRMPSLSQNAQ